MKRKPKFRVGQVVSVWSFYGTYWGEEKTVGFSGKEGWRHGWTFGKIVKLVPPGSMKKSASYCYFLDGLPAAFSERYLRPLTKTERGG